MTYDFRKYIILIPCLILGSCNDLKKTGSAPSLVEETPVVTPTPDPAPAVPQTKEEELAQLVSEFRTRYSATFSYEIGFKPASYMSSGGGSTTTVGVCEVYSDGSKKIHMNQDWWPTANVLSKKVLTFHELGHCYFQRAHDTRIYSGGRPYSMMNPILDPVIAYYQAYETYYLNELQNPMALTIQTYPITYKTNSDGTCLEE